MPPSHQWEIVGQVVLHFRSTYGRLTCIVFKYACEMRIKTDMRSKAPYVSNEGLSAPPPLLLYGVFTLFVIGMIAIIGMINYLSSRRLMALVPYIIAALIAFVLATVIGTLLFRRGLPRWVLPILLVFWAGMGVVSALGGVAVYQNVLPPRYQTELLTPLPFMRAFLPATPAGGIVPTVAVSDDDMSAEDLLGFTFNEATDEATAEATEQAALSIVQAVENSTATPTTPPTSAPPTATTTPLADTATAPTFTAPAQPLATDIPAISTAAVPPNGRVFGYSYIEQTWNNCGPANITMALSVYGWREPQTYAAQFLKPSSEDKNVTPQEMAAFVNEQTGVRAYARVGGDLNLLKQLITNNFPVIIETAAFFEGYDWIGHYQTIVGYDDSFGAFFAYDSYLGTGTNEAGLVEPYAEFDENWSAFNRVFIVIYDQERESLVEQILGERATEDGAVQHALTIAQQEARLNPRDRYAWFNLGSALTALGQYEQAARAYDRARTLELPFRMMWYQFGAFEAYYNVGRYDDVLALVNSNLTTGGEYVEETYYWQGRVLAAQGNSAGASQAYQLALFHNDRFQVARDALNVLGS